MKNLPLKGISGEVCVKNPARIPQPVAGWAIGIRRHSNEERPGPVLPQAGRTLHGAHHARA
jgi:hypothetical protein